MLIFSARICPALLGFALSYSDLQAFAQHCSASLGVACPYSDLLDVAHFPSRLQLLAFARAWLTARCLLDMLGIIRVCLVFLASCFCSLGFVIRRCKLNGVAWFCLGWALVFVWIIGLRLGLVGFARLALNLPALRISAQTCC